MIGSTDFLLLIKSAQSLVVLVRGPRLSMGRLLSHKFTNVIMTAIMNLAVAALYMTMQCRCTSSGLLQDCLHIISLLVQPITRKAILKALHDMTNSIVAVI